MFINLDQLPAGQSMFTVSVSDVEPGEDAYYEDIDIVAPSSSSADEIRALAQVELDRDFEPGLKIVGIANQSDGYWVWRAEGWV